MNRAPGEASGCRGVGEHVHGAAAERWAATTHAPGDAGSDRILERQPSGGAADGDDDRVRGAVEAIQWGGNRWR